LGSKLKAQIHGPSAAFVSDQHFEQGRPKVSSRTWSTWRTYNWQM